MSWLNPYNWFFNPSNPLKCHNLNKYLQDVLSNNYNCVLDNKIFDFSDGNFDMRSVTMFYIYINRYTKNLNIPFKMCFNVIQFPCILDDCFPCIYKKYGSYVGITYQGMIIENFYTDSKIDLLSDDVKTIMDNIKFRYSLTGKKEELDFYKLYVFMELFLEPLFEHINKHGIKDKITKMRVFYALQRIIDAFESYEDINGNDTLMFDVFGYLINWNERKYFMPGGIRAKFTFPFYLINSENYVNIKSLIPHNQTILISQLNKINALSNKILKNNKCLQYYTEIKKRIDNN